MTNWCRVGTFVAPKSKRFEAIGLIILAMTAIAELTISANNFEILKSKFDGVVERLGTMAETQVIVDCSPELHCPPGHTRLVVYSERFSDQAIPDFYNSNTAKIAKLIFAVVGTLFVFLGKWFDGYKASAHPEVATK